MSLPPHHTPSDGPMCQFPDPALLRLAHAVADLSPALAQSLCLDGLAGLDDPSEREWWKARLAPFLDEGRWCSGWSAQP